MDRIYTYPFSAILKYKKLLIIIIISLAIPIADAQIVITSPINNQIQQRDTSGVAGISVTVYAFRPYSRVEAFLIPIEGNINENKSWIFDQKQIMQGFLTALLEAETGWYKLQLLGFYGNNAVDSAVVQRVGIGEVFLVAGNSNSMGLPHLGAKTPSKNIISFDAVNKVLNQENITVAPDEPMQIPEFSPIRDIGFIFPSGETSWYWGELGDLLYKRLKTPVLFLNAAWAAANSENYRDAASGKDAFNMYVGKYWPNRQPYSNIVNTLRYFNSGLGIRAVLWAHGENDAQLKFTEEAYFENIKTLIQNSREDSGLKVPWMIATNTTSFTLTNSYLPIVKAQTRLSSIPDFNTFAGPDLDTIQIPRPVSGHFENVAGGKQGLTFAANAWNQILTDSLFKTIIPVQPKLAIHTGIVPSRIFPGASFKLPFRVDQQGVGPISLRAELIDNSGKFVDVVGIGNENPLTITIPINLKNGPYKIRLVRLGSILTGSISGSFDVNNFNRKIDYVNSITAKSDEAETYIAWLLAAHPPLKSMVLQRTTDREKYHDITKIEAFSDENESQVFDFADPNTNNTSTYYRLKFEHKNGEISYSTEISMFQEGAPAELIAFPNPVMEQQFFIRPESQQKDLKFKLFDSQGREHPIYETDREVTGLIAIRPVYHLPSGVYILKIETKTEIKTQTIIFK